MKKIIHNRTLCVEGFIYNEMVIIIREPNINVILNIHVLVKAPSHNVRLGI